MMSGVSSGNRNQTKRDMTANSKSPVKCRIPLRLQNKSNIYQTPRQKSVGSTGRTTPHSTPSWGNKCERLSSKSTGKSFPMTKYVRDEKQNRNNNNNTVSFRTCAYGRPNMPKQEAVRIEEDIEVQEHQFSYDDFEPLRTEVNTEVKESVDSLRGKLINLKISWQEQINNFDDMKKDLGIRQAELMKLYASLCKTHNELLASGQKTVLPPPDELSIMNVAKLTPEQLLQMCADANKEPVTMVQTSHTDCLAVNKFYDVSSKLVDTCKEALEKRKNIIEWFDNLMKLANNPKGRGMCINKLDEKVREFNEENENLRQCLEDVRLEFYSEMQVIVEYFREAVNDAIYNQLHAEQLTCKLSEINAQNLDLKKALNNLEHTRINKVKIDELKKDLCDERREKTTFKERADIAEIQLKEKEQALEKLSENAAGLEQTIQELKDQNHQLRENFDQELNKLMNSITKNTANLNEIAKARENLQAEKENIERRYKEQTDQYHDEINKLKKDLNQEVEKRIATDAKYLEMLEKKKMLDTIVENMQKETDKRFADYINKIKYLEEELSRMKEQQELLKQHQNEEFNKEIDNYKSIIDTQKNTIQRLQQAEKKITNQLEDKKEILKSKEQYITSLEDQQKQSELKMSLYEEELSKIKKDINSIQDAWGHFETVDELNEMLSQQRLKLNEATDQIDLLRDEIYKKECDLKAIKEKLKTQEYELKAKTVKALAAKDEEHRNVIKLMKETFEMRIQTEAKLNRELVDKDAEISTLINALKNSKDQVEQLKKNVYTLKDQAAKQKNNDKEVITMLESELAKVNSENMQSINNTDNFDSLIKILEDELISSPKNEERSSNSCPKRRSTRGTSNKHEKYCHQGSPSQYETNQGPKATKIVMGNFVKKTYIANNEEDDDISQKWIPIRGTGIDAYEPTLMKKNTNETYNGIESLDELKDKYLSGKQLIVIPSLLQREKQSRMLRFAQHRLKDTF